MILPRNSMFRGIFYRWVECIFLESDIVSDFVKVGERGRIFSKNFALCPLFSAFSPNWGR